MRRLLQGGFALFAAALVIGVAGATAGGLGGPTSFYIVQMVEEPVATYQGGVPGLAATKPAKGQKIDSLDQKVQRYAAYLDSRHEAVLGQVGGAKKLYDYRYVVNGFAAELSEAQVAKLERLADVASVEEVEEWHVTTSTTPDFLGLTGPGNLWAQLGGPSSGTNAGNATGAGEGIVVGVIDTGIWPEHPSVSDRVDGRLMYRNIPHWRGKCTPAGSVTDGSWNANLCNQKLVGARFFLEQREAILGPVTAPDFRSPRDLDGHGTHTATTAAGNHGITPTGDADGFGAISGMAPRARISAYKVCWPSCFTSDSAAAFDQAVADGVDVINFSISGSTTSVTSVVMNATRRAAAAGVFVAMSAGNSGPGAGTVAHVAPWVTTVGASTHPRPAIGIVTLGDGQTFTGVSQIKETVGPAPVIRAQDAGLPDADPNLLRQCFSSQEPVTEGNAQLDPAIVAGKIVVCERGGAGPLNARVDKSLAVGEAGGVGMIQINVAAGASLNGDLHFVPSVHLASTALAPVQAYAQTAGATATLSPGPTDPIAAPFIAAFSSRGPQAGTGSLLKPDVTAPGVDILAGYSPVGAGRLFEIVSGTSMSSPHVAGLAALLKHRHPTWSPMTIKSALMTTGYDILGTFASNPTASGEAHRTFAQGAGHVSPTPAADPGLVFEHSPDDWGRYVCGVGQASCDDPLNPSDLNGASIAIGAMPGSQTVPRTARSVGSTGEMYTASVSGLPGIDVSVAPAVFTVAPGATQAFELTFTRTTAPLNTYQAGHLTLNGSAGHVVRIPLVIRPVAIAAPTQVTLDESNGASWSIKSGVSGTIDLVKTGLLAADTDELTLEDDPGNSFSPGGPGTWSKQLVDVPVGTLVRFELFDEDTDGDDDLDLYLFRGATLVSASGSPTSRELVQHRNTAGVATYTIWVHAWQTDGPDATFTLFGWSLAADEGNYMLTPSTVEATPGSEHTIELSSTGLTPGARYLGEVAYRQGTTVLARTLVTGKAQ